MGLFDGTELERPVACPQCGKDVKTCGCDPADFTPAPEKQRLKLRLEKRKRGKLVTLVNGFVGSTKNQQTLLKELQQHCGAGGTLGESGIEIQGDHLERIRVFLAQLGYQLN